MLVNKLLITMYEAVMTSPHLNKPWSKIDTVDQNQKSLAHFLSVNLWTEEFLLYQCRARIEHSFSSYPSTTCLQIIIKMHWRIKLSHCIDNSKNDY